LKAEIVLTTLVFIPNMVAGTHVFCALASLLTGITWFMSFLGRLVPTRCLRQHFVEEVSGLVQLVPCWWAQDCQ
jgi:hypothetical protein